MMIETSPLDLQRPPLIRPLERNGHEPGSVRALAKGVLRQAAKDLRAFHDAQEATGRELYRDAYSWVVSNDLSWPYSFINVCEALGVSVEFVRSELLADAQSGWYSHSRVVARRISASFTNLFRRSDLTARRQCASPVEFPPLKSASAPLRLGNS
jgi:hypothetical protein